MPKVPAAKAPASIGVDPGKTGGLCLLNGKGEILTLQVMPQTERDIWEWLHGWRSLQPLGKMMAQIEWIHPAILGIGKSSMSKLYGNYMALRMALIAAEIPFEDVKPRAWQKGLGISPRKKTENRTQWKNRLKAKAQELFPKEKITKDTADALLIAEHCRRKHRGIL